MFIHSIGWYFFWDFSGFALDVFLIWFLFLDFLLLWCFWCIWFFDFFIVFDDFFDFSTIFFRGFCFAFTHQKGYNF